MSSTPIITVRLGKTVRLRPGKSSPSLKGSICKSIPARHWRWSARPVPAVHPCSACWLARPAELRRDRRSSVSPRPGWTRGGRCDCAPIRWASWFQSPLPPTLSALENVMSPGGAARARPRQRAPAPAAAFAQVVLAERCTTCRYRPPAGSSSGSPSPGVSHDPPQPAAGGTSPPATSGQQDGGDG